MEDKKISVITPSYNDGDTLKLHIETFLDQDYENKELILVDDGSTDNTKKILKKYENNKEIKIVYFGSNRGACHARNEGAKIATGDVYSFLPADSFLKPGLLTIWMQMLDENPDCGFIYGGYSFVDNEINKPTWDGGRMVMPYHSQDFDVRELKTANYIDGSYPLRKEVYWGAAKKMGMKDGLWNPQVKSLQDWDFWLSVVVDYGAKGKYYNSLFFETTIPHEGGLSFDSSRNWLGRIKQIKALHNIPESKLCVTAPWAKFHGKAVAKVLDADYQEYPPYKEHDYNVIYVVGFFCYNFEDAKGLFMSPKFLPKVNALRASGKWDGVYPLSRGKRLIHFIGSDILTLHKMTLERLVAVRAFLRTCEVFSEIEATQLELKKLGIESDVVPFPPKKWYDVQPLPKKKAIAIYIPKANELFYFRHAFLGLGKEKGLIHMMPDVDFHVFGNIQEIAPVKAKNYKNWGYVDGVQDIIKETSAIIRITQHDGLPISVAEWIGAGRNALTTVKMPHADHYSLLEFGKRHNNQGTMPQLLKELKAAIYKVLEKPLNEEGAKHYRKWLDADKYRNTIKEYCTYNEKRYWDKRADAWNEQTETDVVKKDKLRGIIQSLSFDSVLDVGCGNGRFTSMFDDKEYSGFDISERLIEICNERFPKKDFFISSVEEVDKHMEGKVDLLFCYTTLEHVPHENIQKAIDALKKVGKNLLLIEPKDFVPTDNYCFNHDYKKLFNVRKRWGMGDKWAYLIKL